MTAGTSGMTPGRLIAVVGPSGAGKDSVMTGIREALPGLYPVRRVVTRAPAQGSEEYDAVSVATFEELSRNGAFALQWGCYGIPITVKHRLDNGTDCLVNLSRRALSEAAGIFPRFIVLNITAQPDTLARRLAARGRETDAEISDRLAEACKPLPEGLKVIALSNDGPLSKTVAQAVARLQPASV